jgi:predicted metal-binding membrane protein
MHEHSTMSMMWMRMPGQTWAGIAMSFLGMWILMTAAMMLPSLVPMLWRYRLRVGAVEKVRLAWLTAVVVAGYFIVWTMLGMTVFPFGVAIAAIEIRWPTLASAMPMAVALATLIAGVLQLTAWKARRLTFFRETRTIPARPGAAWRHGVSLGIHCAYNCAALMTIVLVVGIMDVRAMAMATVAITVERLAPSSVRVARAIGGICVVAGLALIVRTSGFG